MTMTPWQRLLQISLGLKKLIILTDQKGVFDDDPRNNAAANLIDKIHFEDEKIRASSR